MNDAGDKHPITTMLGALVLSGAAVFGAYAVWFYGLSAVRSLVG